ncbi:rRNA maturation RNase YbeY [Sulfurihydrogenibium sp.]|uniref:rRNA maturation RNase YbeY n=1 Tax=Sulfurihydrogenibium sp. TaxID=2053621 RepID=UPI00263558A0|nr:rRNA maturation RNase YbeY [Sulfurihydrogenibium sp.]
MNRILINKEIYDKEITKPLVKDITQKILKSLNLDNVEISITLTDDETIKKINKEWRNKDKPTDVLSFPQGETVEYKYKVLGDVIISLPYAKKQAEEIGHSYKEEIVRLLTHGILHLLGYDHETNEEDAKIMFDLQDKICQKVIYELQVP